MSDFEQYYEYFDSFNAGREKLKRDIENVTTIIELIALVNNVPIIYEEPGEKIEGADQAAKINSINESIARNPDLVVKWQSHKNELVLLLKTVTRKANLRHKVMQILNIPDKVFDKE